MFFVDAGIVTLCTIHHITSVLLGVIVRILQKNVLLSISISICICLSRETEIGNGEH